MLFSIYVNELRELKTQVKARKAAQKAEITNWLKHPANKALECAFFSVAAKQWATHAVLRGGWFLFFPLK